MEDTFGANAHANAAYSIHYLHASRYLSGNGGQGEVVSYPSSALIFCEGWKMLLQESNHSLGTARPQLLPPVQLTLFDISEAWPKSLSDTENALI